MQEKAIILEDVTKHYKTNYGVYEVLQNLSFSINFGERIGILGANGSGKTTLLKILLEIISIESGSINVKFDKALHEISYIPQDHRNALFPWLKVNTNLSLYFRQVNPRLPDNQNRLKYQELFLKNAKSLKFVPDLEKYPYQFSGGEQQLLVILQALLNTPKLLIADEPFSAIDIHKRELVVSYFSQWLNKYQPTLVMVSHNLEDALFLVDRVIILSRESSQIKADIDIPITHPRSIELRETKEFKNLVEEIKESFE